MHECKSYFRHNNNNNNNNSNSSSSSELLFDSCTSCGAPLTSSRNLVTSYTLLLMTIHVDLNVFCSSTSDRRKYFTASGLVSCCSSIASRESWRVVTGRGAAEPVRGDVITQPAGAWLSTNTPTFTPLSRPGTGTGKFAAVVRSGAVALCCFQSKGLNDKEGCDKRLSFIPCKCYNMYHKSVDCS